MKIKGRGIDCKKINEIQAFLEKEVATIEALSKKYFRAATIVDNVDTVLIALTLGGGAGGIGLLSTVVAAPAVIAIEGVVLFTGFFSIIGKYSVKKSTSKTEKHEKIKTIATTKLDTIASHIYDELKRQGVLDTRSYKKLSSAAKQIASSSLDVGKSVAKEGAKKALEAGKSAAVDTGKKLVCESVNTKIEENFTKIYGTHDARH